MFLVEIYNDNNRAVDPTFRLSVEGESLVNYWDEGLADISGINYRIDTPHGGIVRAQYGALQILPVDTAYDYIGVSIYYTSTDETAWQLLYEGVGFIKERTRTLHTYDLFMDMPNRLSIAAEFSYETTGDTLVDVFDDFFTTEGWDFDSTQAGSTNIDVDFTEPADVLVSDILSNLASTYCHYLVMDAANFLGNTNPTAFLRHISNGVGAAVVIDEFEYHPSKYSYSIVPAKVTVTAGDHGVNDQYAYNSPYFFGPQLSTKAFNASDSVNSTLAGQIKDFYHDYPFVFELQMPLEYFVSKGINLLTKNIVQWEETTVLFPYATSTFQMVVTGIAFNIQTDRVTLTGSTVRI